MPATRRIRTKNPTVTNAGGGGGVTPTIQWGPDFGESSDNNTFDVGCQITMPALGLEGNANVGCQITMPSLDAVYNAATVGCRITGSVLGAPFFQGIGITTQTANSTSVVLTPDATANNGDFLIVNIASSALASEGTLTAPSGWTHLRTTNSAGATVANLHTYYKFAGAGEASSYTFTGGSNTAHLGTIIRLTAVDTGTPINVENSATGNTADPVSPSITTTVANCFMLTVCSQSNSLTQTYTPPAGYVERADHTGSAVGVAQVTSETATRVQSVTGASGTATHNSNQALGSQWAAHHIAIAPTSLIIAS